MTVQHIPHKMHLLKPRICLWLNSSIGLFFQEPLKTGESLEKTLVELMTMKTALLEDQFQNALTSQAGKI